MKTIKVINKKKDGRRVIVSKEDKPSFPSLSSEDRKEVMARYEGFVDHYSYPTKYVYKETEDEEGIVTVEKIPSNKVGIYYVDKGEKYRYVVNLDNGKITFQVSYATTRGNKGFIAHMYHTAYVALPSSGNNYLLIAKKGKALQGAIDRIEEKKVKVWDTKLVSFMETYTIETKYRKKVSTGYRTFVGKVEKEITTTKVVTKGELERLHIVCLSSQVSNNTKKE